MLFAILTLLIAGPADPDVVSIDSRWSGPTVMVIGGIHGDEPAGAMAAEQIASWRIARGRLVVVPRGNPPALSARTRRTPGLEARRSDLNRQFPSDDSPITVRARALWSIVERVEPDFLLDLHEGYGFHRQDSESVGSSVIADETAATRVLARAMIEAIDETIRTGSKRFSLLGPPIAGSLARAAHERLGISTMIVETTTKGQAAAFRARQHRILVHSLLAELEMAEHGPHVLVDTSDEADEADESADTSVAMFVSGGVTGPGPRRLETLLDDDHGFDLRQVCATDSAAESSHNSTSCSSPAVPDRARRRSSAPRAATPCAPSSAAAAATSVFAPARTSRRPAIPGRSACSTRSSSIARTGRAASGRST